MPVADAKIIKENQTITPFDDASDDQVSNLANMLIDQSDGILDLKRSLEKGVVPLLTSIEKNTRLIDPIKVVRRKARAAKMAGAKTAEEIKPSPQIIQTQPISKIKPVPEIPTVEKPIPTISAKPDIKKELPDRPEKKETASKVASAEIRQKKEQKQEQKGIAESIKTSLSDWEGDIFSKSTGKDDLSDVAGAATGGAFWASVKELSEAATNISESGSDDKGLINILKKSVLAKTGITSVTGKVEGIKGKAVEKVKAWASPGEKTKPLPKGYKKDKAGRLRDEKGHFVSTGKAVAGQKEDSGKDQVEELGNISDTLKSNDKDAEKRHDELINTIAASAYQGPGLVDNVLSGIVEGRSQRGFGGRKGKKDKGRRPRARGKKGRIGKVLSKVGGKFGKLGGIATAVLGGGMGIGGMFPSMLGGLGGFWGGDEDEEISTPKPKGKAAGKTAQKVTKKTATKSTSKMAAMVSKFTGKGALKAGLSGAGKMLRVLGPLAAIATTGIDAYQGYKDKGLQATAFGLKEGEEATTGQKTASAVANVLDLGGLVSGGLNMLGADISTAKIAKGIYSFFGGKEEKGKEALATIQDKGPAPPESMRTVIDNIKKEENSAAELLNSTKPSIDKLAKQVEKLALSLDPGRPISRGGWKKDTKAGPLIQTEFDDSTLTLMAHDRI